MNFLKKYRYDIIIGLIIAAFTVWAYFSRGAFDFLSSKEKLQSFVMSFGVIAPLVSILIIVAEVVFAPIPGLIPAITTGFIFGPIFGSVYTYVGNIVGSLIVFFLARKFGKPIVIKFFGERRVDKYERAVSRHENLLLAFYFFPLVPLDVVTAVFGLSAIKNKKFISTIAIGYAVYSVILNLFGDYLAMIFFGQ